MFCAYHAPTLSRSQSFGRGFSTFFPSVIGSEYSPKLLVINPQNIITNLNNYMKEFTL